MTALHSDSAFMYDVTRDPENAERVARLRKLARLLDAQFTIPGLGVQYGLDALIGLIPGIGDVLTTGLSGYIIYEAQQMGAPPTILARMAGNLVIDAMAGSVPMVGDLFDLAFKANLRNLRLLGITPEGEDDENVTVRAHSRPLD